MSDVLRPVNLALGGGGAKGFVHIGVIEELVRQGYEIKSIVGTSIGALVGALFAHGVGILFKDKPPRERQRRAAARVRSILFAQDFRKFVDINYFSLLRRGGLRGRLIEEWLNRKLVDFDTAKCATFESLGFDLTVTVTEAATGDPLHLSPLTAAKTDVGRAVRASISIPVVFTDVTVDINGADVRCWDGGTTGNCRFDLARLSDPTRLTIASSVTYGGAAVKLDSLFGVVRAARAFNHMLDVLLRRMEDSMAEALGPETMKNILIVRPKLNGVGTLDFRIGRPRRMRLAAAGRQAMKEALKRHGAA